jgi:hypothetical protein
MLKNLEEYTIAFLTIKYIIQSVHALRTKKRIYKLSFRRKDQTSDKEDNKMVSVAQHFCPSQAAKRGKSPRIMEEVLAFVRH